MILKVTTDPNVCVCSKPLFSLNYSKKTYLNLQLQLLYLLYIYRSPTINVQMLCANSADHSCYLPQGYRLRGSFSSALIVSQYFGLQFGFSLILQVSQFFILAVLHRNSYCIVSICLTIGKYTEIWRVNP